MSIVEILKVVGQGGFPVLFALFLIGLGWIVVKLGPQVFGAWSSMINAINDLKTAMVTAIGDLSAKIAANTAKLETMQVALEAVRAKQDSTAENMAGLAAANTGKHDALSDEEADRLAKDRRR